MNLCCNMMSDDDEMSNYEQIQINKISENFAQDDKFAQLCDESEIVDYGDCMQSYSIKINGMKQLSNFAIKVNEDGSSQILYDQNDYQYLNYQDNGQTNRNDQKELNIMNSKDIQNSQLFEYYIDKILLKNQNLSQQQQIQKQQKDYTQYNFQNYVNKITNQNYLQSQTNSYDQSSQNENNVDFIQENQRTKWKINHDNTQNNLQAITQQNQQNNKLDSNFKTYNQNGTQQGQFLDKTQDDSLNIYCIQEYDQKFVNNSQKSNFRQEQYHVEEESLNLNKKYQILEQQNKSIIKQDDSLQSYLMKEKLCMETNKQQNQEQFIKQTSELSAIKNKYEGYKNFDHEKALITEKNLQIFQNFDSKFDQKKLDYCDISQLSQKFSQKNQINDSTQQILKVIQQQEPQIHENNMISIQQTNQFIDDQSQINNQKNLLRKQIQSKQSTKILQQKLEKAQNQCQIHDILEQILVDKQKEEMIIFESELLKFKPGVNFDFIKRWCQITTKKFKYFKDLYSAKSWDSKPLFEINIEDIKSTQRVKIDIPKKRQSSNQNVISNNPNIKSFEIIVQNNLFCEGEDHQAQPSENSNLMKIDSQQSAIKNRTSSSFQNKIDVLNDEEFLTSEKEVYYKFDNSKSLQSLSNRLLLASDQEFLRQKWIIILNFLLKNI